MVSAAQDARSKLIDIAFDMGDASRAFVHGDSLVMNAANRILDAADHLVNEANKAAFRAYEFEYTILPADYIGWAQDEADRRERIANYQATLTRLDRTARYLVDAMTTNPTFVGWDGWEAEERAAREQACQVRRAWMYARCASHTWTSFDLMPF
jgi:hypothetical protein